MRLAEGWSQGRSKKPESADRSEPKAPSFLSAEELVAPLDAPPVDLVERLLLPPRPAAVDHRGEERLHGLQRVGQIRRLLLEVLVEAQVPGLPGFRPLLLELLLEEDPDQGMGVQGARLMGIGGQEEAVLPEVRERQLPGFLCPDPSAVSVSPGMAGFARSAARALGWAGRSNSPSSRRAASSGPSPSHSA